MSGEENGFALHVLLFTFHFSLFTSSHPHFLIRHFQSGPMIFLR